MRQSGTLLIGSISTLPSGAMKRPFADARQNPTWKEKGKYGTNGFRFRYGAVSASRGGGRVAERTRRQPERSLCAGSARRYEPAGQIRQKGKGYPADARQNLARKEISKYDENKADPETDRLAVERVHELGSLLSRFLCSSLASPGAD